MVRTPYFYIGDVLFVDTYSSVECISLWAGQGHQLAESLSAADIVEKLAASARTAADQVHARLHKK